MALDSRYVTSWLVEAVEKLTNLYVPELTVGYNSGCCSDQQSFYEQGYPAMGYGRLSLNLNSQQISHGCAQVL